MDYGYLLLVVWAIVLVVVVEGADIPLGFKCRPTGVDHSPIFQTNLNQLMRKFQTNLPALHYVEDKITSPENKNNVYAFIMCRGDTTVPQCRACVATAVAQLLQECGNEREGGIWYDNCMMKYGDLPFFGNVDHRDDFFLWDPKQVTNMAELNQKSKGLLTGLIPACTKAPNRFASGTAPFGQKTIYGMVQCSRGISPENCGKCLSFQIAKIGPMCCNGMEGGRVVGTSCNVRYEMHPFLH